MVPHELPYLLIHPTRANYDLSPHQNFAQQEDAPAPVLPLRITPNPNILLVLVAPPSRVDVVVGINAIVQQKTWVGPVDVRMRRRVEV